MSKFLNRPLDSTALNTEQQLKKSKTTDNLRATKPVARKLNTTMSDEDFGILKDYDKQNNIEGFVTNYKEKYQGLSENDIITLALMRAVSEFDVPLQSKIMNILYKNKTTSVDFLVTFDENGKNTIVHALEHGSCIPQLEAYIYGLVQNNKIKEKFTLDEDIIGKIAKAIVNDKTETHPISLIEDLIEPVYTEESIQELVKAIGEVSGEASGEDYLDSWYV